MPAPPLDLHVRQCTVRVRRRDGWSWGDPEDLVPEVLAAVEAALAEVLVRVGPIDADVRLSTPVRLSLGPPGAAGPAVVDGVHDLVARVREAVDRLPVAPEQTPPPRGERSGAPPSAAVAVADDPGVRARTRAGLAAALARWSRDGTLDLVVATWSPAVRALWVRALDEAATEPAGPTHDWSPGAVAAVAHLALGPSDGAPVGVDANARVLTVVGALTAAAQGRLPDAAALDAVRRQVGAPTADADEPAPAVTTAARRAGAAGRAHPAPADVSPARSGTVVVPALPFLVVVQLHRLGYLAPAAAALGVSGLPDAERVLAALVAGKTLPPPAHGWRREDTDTTAVSLVAGLPAPRVAELLAGWAGAADAAPPLTGILAGLYADDPDPDGLVLTRLDDGAWICGEAGGMPIAWGSGRAELTGLLRQLGGEDPVEADLFAELADRLHARRAALGQAAEPLERHLGAVVGAALGSLAAELWGARARPLDVLDRLADLEARAVAGPDGLVLALPRGQRWIDLRRAGLLDAWPMPWAPGGRWELVTW